MRPYLSDEAHFPGGHSPMVWLPAEEGQVAGILAQAPAVVVSGARSSLTGGATPYGEWVVSMERMDEITLLSAEEVRAGPGATLTALAGRLAAGGLWYPPAPTFLGATAGGVVSTNAAGAATFKYGSTRGWVRGLSVMLATGEVLEVERGQVRAHPEGWFEIDSQARGVFRVPVPDYVMPKVAKRSAGYHAEPGMDLVDLFCGSEGTLGVILSVTFAVARRDFATFTALSLLDGEDAAIRLATELRETSLATREARDPSGVDVAAIEMMDGRCLEMLREDGSDKANGVWLSEADRFAVLLQAELRPPPDGAQAMDELASHDNPEAPDTPLRRLCRIVARHADAGRMQVALPGEKAREAQLFAIREAVPVGLNRRIGELQRRVHPGIQKVAADMCVPFDRFPEMMRIYREGFGRRGLDHAIWGHISDGNVHPNVVPHSYADVEQAKDAVLEFGRELARLGGCPLSEHGVGRSPVKQELLRQLYGDAGIEAMRRVKRALDPEWKLAPGVIFRCSPPFTSP